MRLTVFEHLVDLNKVSNIRFQSNIEKYPNIQGSTLENNTNIGTERRDLRYQTDTLRTSG
jgi:hypothetical protein